VAITRLKIASQRIRFSSSLVRAQAEKRTIFGRTLKSPKPNEQKRQLAFGLNEAELAETFAVKTTIA